MDDNVYLKRVTEKEIIISGQNTSLNDQAKTNSLVQHKAFQGKLGWGAETQQSLIKAQTLQDNCRDWLRHFLQTPWAHRLTPL